MYRYSQRLFWAAPENLFSSLVAARRRSPEPLFDLTISNPTEVQLAYPHAEIASAYRHVSDFTYTPEPFGSLKAREAISAFYLRRNLSVAPDRIALTASTSEAYSLLFKLFCDPGDEILVPLPSYPLFEYLAALENARIVPYRLHYDGSWFLDLDSMRRALSTRTRAIVVVNPNNPTGSYLNQVEADSILSLAAEHHVPVICDEVFMDFRLEQSSDQVLTFAHSDSALSFSLNGLSKSVGMPQMKLGWIVVNGPASERALAARRLELLLDTYLAVNTPVQHALPSLLETGERMQSQMVGRISENLACGTQILNDSPAHFLRVEGGWSAILQIPRTLSEEGWITRLLQEQSVIVQPGYFFDMTSEAYLVVSLITAPEIFRTGLERLRLILEG